MHFQQITARPDWQEHAQNLGYLAGLFDDPPYWVEALEQPFCAVVTMEEVEDKIEQATAALTELALAAVDYVCTSEQSAELFERLKIPVSYWEIIRRSWSREDPALYGRFDFSYNNDQVKLLEL